MTISGRWSNMRRRGGAIAFIAWAIRLRMRRLVVERSRLRWADRDGLERVRERSVDPSREMAIHPQERA